MADDWLLLHITRLFGVERQDTAAIAKRLDRDEAEIERALNRFMDARFQQRHAVP